MVLEDHTAGFGKTPLFYPPGMARKWQSPSMCVEVQEIPHGVLGRRERERGRAS